MGPRNLVKVRTIGLDSSIIGILARDLAHGPATDKREASAFLDCLTDNGLVPLVTLHHLCETLQHADDDVVDQRLSFLYGLPLVAWLDTLNPPGRVGSILDVRAAEIRQLLGDKDMMAKNVVRSAKMKL